MWRPRSFVTLVDLETMKNYLALLLDRNFREGKGNGYPGTERGVRWFLQSMFERGKRETPYVYTVWCDTDDGLHLESEVLGNTIDMAEWMYGSEYTYKHADVRHAIDMTGFCKPEGRTEYAKEFSRVVARLSSYERFVSKMASRLGVDMRLLVHGGQGIASFLVGAEFGTKELTVPLILHEIDRNVAALRPTYYEIAERQRTLYFMWAL